MRGGWIKILKMLQRISITLKKAVKMKYELRNLCEAHCRVGE